MMTKTVKLRRRLTRKMVASTINSFLILVVLIGALMLWFQVANPLIKHLQGSGQLFKSVQQTIDDFANFQSINDLFDPNHGIISQIPDHIDAAQAQSAWNHFETNFNNISIRLKQLDQSTQIFTNTSQLANQAIVTIKQLASDLGVQLNQRGLVGINAITQIDQQANLINNLLKQWTNFDFDKILTILNQSQTIGWQVILKDNFQPLITSRLILMALTITLAVVVVIIVWIYLLISAIKWRIVNFNQVNSGWLTINIFANLILLPSFISWWLVKNRYQKALNQSGV